MARQVTTASTANFAINSTSGWNYSTGSQQITIGGFIWLPNITTTGYLLMQRVAGGGAFIGVGVALSTVSTLSLGDQGTTEYNSNPNDTRLRFQGLESTWRFVCWTKQANGNGLFQSVFGAPGSISSANFSTMGTSSAFCVNAAAGNRVTLFSGWGAGDSIVLPVAAKTERWGIWIRSAPSSTDIINWGNGSAYPEELGAYPLESYRMPSTESGNISSYVTSNAQPLTVSGSVLNVAGPFDGAGSNVIKAMNFYSMMRNSQ